LIRQFFDQGCSIACVDKEETWLEKLKADLTKEYSAQIPADVLNKRLRFYNSDITSVAQVKEMAKSVKRDFGKVDILIK
jgi:NAD(P)-dependent dehydrogenase (short-subunit alcohol dehydrogenase family)